MTIRLLNPEDDRYERLKLIRWWDQEKLHNAQVLVLGAGALGNEVLKNLALLGAGSVYVADFDAIETTNLTRSALFRQTDVGKPKAQVAAERASEINPDCRVHALELDVRFGLGLGFISKIDLIFGCVDNREARYYVNRSCYLLKKLFLDGGLDTLNGSVSVFHAPETPCYECTLTRVDRAELQKRISCLKSQDPEIKQHVPTAPTTAAIIAGLQVQIGIRALHGLHIPEGKRIGMYGLSDVFFEIKLEKSEDCGLHSATDPLPESLHTLDALETDPLASVLAIAKQRWKADSLIWDFDRDLIVTLQCTSCGTRKEFVGTFGQFGGSDQCSCGGAFKPQIAIEYTGKEEWGNKSFRELGFPADHIYCAQTPEGRIYFRLNRRNI